MMCKNILITGGAGFIGSFLADKLIKEGYSIRIFDNLEEQVHQNRLPTYLNKKAEFIKGDVRDCQAFKDSLENIDAIFHLAAAIGVQQSQYQIKRFVDVNMGGMGNLLDIVINQKSKVKKIVLMASMTSYGEGVYFCEKCGKVKPPLRNYRYMEKKDWEMHCPFCHSYVKPIATNEETSLSGNSIYALTKKMQEEMLFNIGKTYDIPVVSLRGFNIYGPRQSISNPYTGVTAIFISRLKNNKSPILYEDGLQTRDFVSVYDAVEALFLALIKKEANYRVINIGSGKATTIKELAYLLARLLGKKIDPKITGKSRKNDIRHCFADITKAKKLLAWKPKVSLREGLKNLIKWADKEEAKDLFDKAEEELRKRKII